MSNLTDKQALFVQYYAETLNATDAARRAGYQGNDNTLAQIGFLNLRKLKIKTEIDKLLGKKVMESDEVLERLSDQARTDLSDFFDLEDGKIVLNLTKALEAGKTHLIKSIKTDGKTGRVTQVYFHDPQNALIHLGKAYGMFRDVVQVEDWRKEVEAHDGDPSEIFNKLVELIASSSR